MFSALFLANVAATWFMAGVIWFVQLVHYPLMALVGTERWRSYEEAHCRWTSVVVIPAMSVELVSAAALAAFAWDGAEASAGLPAWALYLGAGLAGFIWLTTFFLQVPLHMRLDARFDPVAHRRLVTSNALRTAAWTARAALMTWLLAGRVALT